MTDLETRRDPTVSFVVPCYKLAHLLPECVRSILSQSFRDLEVLVMDDCSPDDTAAVARSFRDPRVRHVRNDPNLGALRNYNKGIGMSRGRYVWLISADDYLRRPYILQRYVELMERHPRVGYTICPGVGVRDGAETGVLSYSTYGDRDRIVRGHVFMKTILQSCFVMTPSALVRRECYEKIGDFPVDVVRAGTPIDFIWGGDWYLWCAFALQYDVAYFAEPMVCYREHELASTTIVTRESMNNCLLADIAVLWMIKERADAARLRTVSRDCLRAISDEYARQLAGKRYRAGTGSITFDQFEESLARNGSSEGEKDWIRARVYSAIADRCYSAGDDASAGRFYRAGLERDPSMARVHAKAFLLSLGKSGHTLRDLLRSLRH